VNARDTSKLSPKMHKQKSVQFHRVFEADKVDRAILWNAKTQKTTYLTLEFLEANDLRNKYGKDIKFVNGSVPESDIAECQMLLLGGQNLGHFKIGKLSNIAGSPNAQERFAFSPLEKQGLREVRKTPDVVIINAPKQFSYVIINPHPHLKEMGWKEPLLLDVMEKPKVDQPSELFARGIDPSDECRHFVGSLTWTLTDAEIRDWDKFAELEVEVCLYTSYLLQDMRVRYG